MTARELLERIIRLRKAIDYRKTKIQVLAAQAERTSARLTGMPHSPGKGSSQMEAVACRKMDLEREISELDAERRALIAQIDLLENGDLSRLLTLRYVQEEKWEDIMAEMCFCRSHIFRLHQQAILLLENSLKDGTK